MGPIDVPSGRFALIQDPQGAAFAILQSDVRRLSLHFAYRWY